MAIVPFEGSAQQANFKTVLQTGHSKAIFGTRISPSGRYAASYSLDNSVILWDLGLMKQIATYQLEHQPKVVEFDLDEQFLYAYTAMGQLMSWDLNNGSSDVIVDNKKGDVTWCHIWDERKSIVTVHNDRFNVVDLKTGKTLKSKIVDEEKGYIYGIEVGQKQNILIVAFSTYNHQKDRLIIYDKETLSIRHEIPEWVTTIAYSEKNNVLIMPDHKDQVLKWMSLSDMKIDSVECAGCEAATISPDQDKLVVVARESATQVSDIFLYDIPTRSVIKTFPFAKKYNAKIRFASDDRLLMTTEKQGIHLIDIDKAQIVKSFRANLLPIVDLGYDVKENRLATHHQDTIYLWDRMMQRATIKLINGKKGFADAHYGYFPTYRSSNEEFKEKAALKISTDQAELIESKVKIEEPSYYAKVSIIKPASMDMLKLSHDGKSVFMSGRRFQKVGENMGLYQFFLATNELLTFGGHARKVEFAEASHDGQHVYSVGSGEIKVWDRSNQQEIAKSYVFNTGGFVTITPDGYYTSSLNAVDQVVFADGMNAYTFENFDLNYNRPDIIADRLGLASPEFVSALKKAWVKRLNRYGLSEAEISIEPDLPLLKLKSDIIPLETNHKYLEIEVSATSSKPLNRYIVTINGVPMNHSAALKIEGTSDTRKIRVELTAGENRIKVACLNSAGFKSLSESVSVNYLGSRVKPNLYLVAIGVSEFKQKDFNLTYADKDARDVATLFENGSQYDKVISIPLLNKSANLKEVDNVKAKLKGARPEDHMIIFVASHGLLSEDLDYYLAMNDVDFESPASGGLLYENLEALFKLCEARNRLVLLDACHSGEVDKGEATLSVSTSQPHANVNSRGFKSVSYSDRKVGLKSSFDLMKELFVDLQQSTGATVISSASGEEYAYESAQWNNGVFTYALLNGLKSKAADKNKDGKIRVSEIQQYVYEQVSALTAGKQNPTSRTENTENDFVVW